MLRESIPLIDHRTLQGAFDGLCRHNVGELTDLQRQAAYWVYSGMGDDAIGQMLGVKSALVSGWRREELFQAEVSRIQNICLIEQLGSVRKVGEISDLILGEIQKRVEGGDCKLSDLTRTWEALSDREPSGRFRKHTVLDGGGVTGGGGIGRNVVATELLGNADRYTRETGSAVDVPRGTMLEPVMGEAVGAVAVDG